MDNVEIPAMRLFQKGIPVYSGKMKASDLLELSAIDEWKETHLKGYQRGSFEEKEEEISQYLVDCPIALMPGILASMRTEFEFIPVHDDLGVLHIPKGKGSLYLMDGQQRTGGMKRVSDDCSKLRERKADLSKDEQGKLKELEELLDSYEVPIILVDTKAVMKEIQEHAPDDMKIEPQHAEMAYFFIVNKTQKAVNPSLKDQLAYNMVRAGIQGIPVIEREKWRALVVPVVNALNTNGSPLAHQINLGGARGLHRPVRLSSFVTALSRFFNDSDAFTQIGREDQIAYLKAYWNVVQRLWPKAFAEATKRQWLILNTIGVYTLNRLAYDVFKWCQAKGATVPIEKNIEPYLMPLKNVDWTKENSPFAAYGGQKGVTEAYKMLLGELSAAGIPEARAILEKPVGKQNRKKGRQQER